MKNIKNRAIEKTDARRLLEAAFEAAAHSTVIADRNGYIVWVNPAFTLMTGYNREEAIGEKTSLLKSGEQDVSFYSDLWETVLSGETWRGNLRNRRKDGTTYLEKQTITPVLGENGSIEYFVAIKEDVTELVRLQEAVRQTGNRYRRLFDNSPLPLWEEDYSAVKTYIDGIKSSGVTDLKTFFEAHSEAVKLCASMVKIVDVNEAALKISGASDKDSLLGDLSKFFNETTYNDFKNQLVWLAKGNLFYESEVENMTLDGERLYINLKLSIAPAFSSCWGEVILSLEDITERKQHDKQIARALKMEAIGQLTHGIAHDFNNVLTVIDGNLRLLAEMSGSVADSEMGEMLSDALSAAEDGAKLTTRLLAFSRKPVANVDLASIEGVVTEFAEFMQQSLGSGIEVVTQIAEDLATVKTDQSAFGNVLLNLSLNARDAMESKGRLTFSVHNGEIESEGSTGYFRFTETIPCVIIEVTDTGAGMSDTVRERAIEPFFTTKDLDEGSGLGLSIVHDFIRAYGGDLRLSSTLGEGTCVAMYLPLQCSDRHTVSGHK